MVAPERATHGRWQRGRARVIPVDNALPAVAGPDGIPILRYSTSDLPPDQRYSAWLRRAWPRAGAIFHTQPTEPFDTTWESAQLDLVTFVHTKITGMRWERRQRDIRTSDFDPIVVTMMLEGLAQGDCDGRPFSEPAGTFHFHDLARPSDHVSTASVTYSLIIARPVAANWFGPLHDLHGLVVGGASAEMLFSQAAQVHRGLPALHLAQVDALGRVFLELLAVALAGSRSAETRATPEGALRRRAAEEIERRLGVGEVKVADLCPVLGATRAQLFAAFRADGGVQAYVLTERLARAYAALSDVELAEPIGNIAHRLGFSDASHLSRAFRQRYGMSPREYRNLIASAGQEH